MIIVGFILLVAAAVVAIALVVQNPSTVTVHAFTWSWDVDLRWLVRRARTHRNRPVRLAMMRIGGSHYLRLRSERKVLAAENKRLSERAAQTTRTRSGYRTAPRDGAVPAPAPMTPIGARSAYGAPPHRLLRRPPRWRTSARRTAHPRPTNRTVFARDWVATRHRRAKG